MVLTSHGRSLMSFALLPLNSAILIVVTSMLFLTGCSRMDDVHTIQPSDIVGTWEAENKIAKIEIFQSGDEYQARLLFHRKMMEADGKTFMKDVKNSDPTLRSRSLENLVYITGLKWDGAKWAGGFLYYPP